MDWLTRYDGAGRSAMATYRARSKRWRRRKFGRRTAIYIWTLSVLLAFLALHDLHGGWLFMAGALIGGADIGWASLGDALLPDHTRRWERGAWGEQETAKQLRQLKRRGWTIRHDLGGGYGNRDHIAVGAGVFLLDTKWLLDVVTLEGTALRVRRIDAPDDSYVIDGFVGRMHKAAKSLSIEARTATGYGVWVHPVAVVWGVFEPPVQHAEGVAFVRGDQLRQFLLDQPNELPAQKRQAVAAWVQALPRFEPR